MLPSPDFGIDVALVLLARPWPCPVLAPESPFENGSTVLG